MTLRLQTFLTGLLALLTAALLELAPASANPASGGYQLFEPAASEHQADIQLASLGNFDYHAKVASECCNAPKSTLPSGYTRNADGTVRGPQGGTYTVAGTDLNGQQVYRDSGGRYYTLGGGTKTQVSNPAGSPNVTITQQNAHHQEVENDITGQLQSQGYTTSTGSFYSNCGSTICYPDIIYSAPGSNKITGVLEVKIGGAGPSTNQSTVYPQIGTGDAVPGPSIANAYGLSPNVAMNQQGYPNGVPVYQITAPGLN